MLKSRTALGIAILDNRITLALLRKNGDGVKLLKSDSCTVPDGAIKNGNIEDPTALVKAIKKLKPKNKIRSHRTAISLVANPTLMQILDLPKAARGDVRQFVYEEVKHYAALPINRAAVDFCGIKSTSKTDERRVLVVATDSQKITNAAKAFNRQGLNIDAIEPSWMAYVRACYEKKIAKKPDTNMLFATVFDNTLTLSLFRNQILDFVRTERLEPDTLQPEQYFERLAEEINAVIKFYELKISNSNNKWKVTLVTNINDESIKEKTESIRTKLNQAELEFRTLEHVHLTTAMGLAMKLLLIPGCGLNMNFLPQEIISAKSTEKQSLVIANIAAIILFLIILSIGYFNVKVEKVSANIRQSEQTQASQNTQALLSEQTLLQKQISDVSTKVNIVNKALNTGLFLRWGDILTDIRLATPKTVRITELFSSDNSKMTLVGHALSYEAIYLFVEELNTCKNIESASLIGTQKSSQLDDMLCYSIICSLKQ